MGDGNEELNKYIDCERDMMKDVCWPATSWCLTSPETSNNNKDKDDRNSNGNVLELLAPPGAREENHDTSEYRIRSAAATRPRLEEESRVVDR